MRANAASIPLKGVTMSSWARLGKKKQPALSWPIITGCSGSHRCWRFLIGSRQSPKASLFLNHDAELIVARRSPSR
jgi:hypothetical protein